MLFEELQVLLVSLRRNQLILIGTYAIREKNILYEKSWLSVSLRRSKR